MKEDQLTTSAPLHSASGNAIPAGSGTARTVRDPRLDFFRGIAMFVIFIAHTPRDFWALWIPARFGFSDATETFVFCSGMASAIAFGAVFDKRGWLMGAARIAHRVWQVYWSHIGLFFAVLLLITYFDEAGIYVSEFWSGSYVSSLNLQHFYTRTPDLIIGLFTLTYVPNYFDILPMYLVILALVPIVMGLSRISLWAVAAFVLALWLLANAWLFETTWWLENTWWLMNIWWFDAQSVRFPAEPWSNRTWFFNPLGWQLVFFTGFAFMRGWIKPPPVKREYVYAAIVIVIITLPFAYFRIYNAKPDSPLLADIVAWIKVQRTEMRLLIGKSNFGIFRYIHFLATAYLAWVAVGPLGSRIRDWGAFQFVVDTIRKVGQQSLAVFISSLIIAQFFGMIFKVYGNSWDIVLLGNIAGFAALIAVAYTVAWFKSQPWRKPAAGLTPVSATNTSQSSGTGTDSQNSSLIKGVSATPAE